LVLIKKKWRRADNKRVCLRVYSANEPLVSTNNVPSSGFCPPVIGENLLGPFIQYVCLLYGSLNITQ